MWLSPEAAALLAAASIEYRSAMLHQTPFMVFVSVFPYFPMKVSRINITNGVRVVGWVCLDFYSYTMSNGIYMLHYIVGAVESGSAL